MSEYEGSEAPGPPTNPDDPEDHTGRGPIVYVTNEEAEVKSPAILDVDQIYDGEEILELHHEDAVEPDERGRCHRLNTEGDAENIPNNESPLMMEIIHSHCSCLSPPWKIKYDIEKN